MLFLKICDFHPGPGVLFFDENGSVRRLPGILTRQIWVQLFKQMDALELQKATDFDRGCGLFPVFFPCRTYLQKSSKVIDILRQRWNLKTKCSISNYIHFLLDRIGWICRNSFGVPHLNQQLANHVWLPGNVR